MGTTRTWRQFDLILLLVAIALFLFGIGVIRSANLDTSDRADLWRTQARFGLIGFGIFLLMAAIPYEWLRHVWWVGYLIALGLLILVLFYGESDIGDVRRWFFIGDFRLQPSFPALFLLIVYVASVFGRPSTKERRLDEVDQPWQDRPGLKQYILSAILALVLAVLVFREPDLSTAMVFLAVWMAMAFVSEVHWIYLVGTLVLAVAALIPLWNVMEPYQQERVLTFFDSSRNPDALYNVQQALISIGSGGVWGKGYGEGSLNRLHFLRVRHTDFIFSVVGEELGFIGATI